MSRTRLVASLSAVACLLALAAIAAVSVFPLKALPVPAKLPEPTVAPAPSSVATEPVVNANSIWTDTVKRGDMPVQIRGRAEFLASHQQVRVSLPELMMADVRIGQSASVDTRAQTIKGHVTSVSAHVEAGIRTAGISLESPFPREVSSSDLVDAMIDIDKLQNVVYVGRPALDPSRGTVPVFRIVDNGKAAQRVSVRFGRVGATTIQVLSGLSPGDTIIISNTSPYDRFARIEIKR
jgi:hypothetical protein